MIAKLVIIGGLLADADLFGDRPRHSPAGGGRGKRRTPSPEGEVIYKTHSPSTFGQNKRVSLLRLKF